METLKQTLMRRDGMTSEEADDAIQEAAVALQQYLAEGDMCSAEEVCAEYFGLEPDYIFDLM